MQCPIDQEELRMAERQGVEIDYCPKCRGVWLDRGELDKIIARVDEESSRTAYPADEEPYGRGPGEPYPAGGQGAQEQGLGGLVREALDAYRGRDRGYDRRYDADRRYDYGRREPRRKGLRDLFDF